MINGRRVTVEADPHITVYTGLNEVKMKQGHIYLVYNEEQVPSRMMHKSERRMPRNGNNPELFDYSDSKKSAVG
jgi:hypothetical protein